MTYIVFETVCERCGAVNDHITAHCEALSLPLCRMCGDQHGEAAVCDRVPGSPLLLAAWRRQLLHEVETLASVTAARRFDGPPF